jgi:organic radical activating enzyme
MRPRTRTIETIGLLLLLAAALRFALPQTPTQPQQTTPQPAPATDAAKPDSTPHQPQTEKQKALALQADKLVAMAETLKSEVDKTNKNILSVTVVHQAEDIERYAHQLKQDARK